jgi:hypothetical protein
MNSLRDKMNNWEARPPAHMWDRISRALDESEMNAAFPERLRSLEISAPDQAWQGIAAKLDSPSVTEGNEAVPMRRHRLVWIRVAAAAAILLLAVWGTRQWWMPAGEAIDAPAALVVKPESTLPKPDNNLPAPGPHVFEADSLQNSLASAQKNNRRADMYAGSDLQYAAAANAEYADELSKAIYVFEDPAENRAEKYVTLLTPEGSFIRVSKKWSHLLCCITGEEPNAVCDKQVKAWQDQMASSPVTPAPGNFMDLLDLVNSLSEGTSL